MPSSYLFKNHWLHFGMAKNITSRDTVIFISIGNHVFPPVSWKALSTAARMIIEKVTAITVPPTAMFTAERLDKPYRLIMGKDTSVCEANIAAKSRQAMREKPSKNLPASKAKTDGIAKVANPNNMLFFRFFFRSLMSISMPAKNMM